MISVAPHDLGGGRLKDRRNYRSGSTLSVAGHLGNAAGEGRASRMIPPIGPGGKPLGIEAA
jgi:hypothetical protein